MIRLISVEIENFRSIIGSPLTVKFSNFTTIVGPNNCGKSNVLRALQLFFAGHIEGKSYSSDIDYPKSTTLSKQSQTKITVTISYEPTKDTPIKRTLDEIELNTKQKKLDHDQITLRLSHSKHGVESWQFIGKLGALNINKDLITKIRDNIRQSVIYKYIPVGRDSLESITHEIGSELIKTIFSGWSGAVKRRKEINDSITSMLEKLKPELKTSSNAVTSSMKSVFSEVQTLELQLPFSNLEEMLPSLRPIIKDTAETGLKSKGAGIQTSSLLFLLKYLADNHPQRHQSRQTFLWAIEEPESFLHPKKQRAMADVLLDFSKEVQTVITTHCPHFIPRDTVNASCYIIDKASKSPWSTELIGTDHLIARQTLGISLLDSMSLFPINLVVEGISDEILLGGALRKLQGTLALNWFDVKFFPSGNAAGAALAFEWMSKQADEETQIRLILDGDKPGVDSLNSLLGRGKRDGISWKSNQDYFQLPIDVENLLSEKVKRALNTERPAQVQLIEDINGKIKSFKAMDTHKQKVAARAIEISEKTDLVLFKNLFERIIKSLDNP